MQRIYTAELDRLFSLWATQYKRQIREREFHRLGHRERGEVIPDKFVQIGAISQAKANGRTRIANNDIFEQVCVGHVDNG